MGKWGKYSSPTNGRSSVSRVHPNYSIGFTENYSSVLYDMTMCTILLYVVYEQVVLPMNRNSYRVL